MERTARDGAYRAKLRIAPVGDDRTAADLLVQYLGRSDAVDANAELARWMKEFDGDVARGAQREQLEVGPIHVHAVEVAGDYQQPIGPPVGPGGKFAAHVIQRGWRGIAAVANAGAQGVWLFRLVGPSDTVQSARSAMMSLLRSLHIPGAQPPDGDTTISPAPPAGSSREGELPSVTTPQSAATTHR